MRTIAVLMDTSASMDLLARTAPDDDRTRRQIAEEILSDPAHGGNGLLEELQQRYKVELYHMDATARRLQAENRDLAERSQSTDFAAALRRLNGDIPSSSLSGVVLLTDGCDHSDADIHEATGFLENSDIPLNSVMIGSSEPVRDAEIVTLQAPSQIYHGDELTLQAVVRADQFQDMKSRPFACWKATKLLKSESCRSRVTIIARRSVFAISRRKLASTILEWNCRAWKTTKRRRTTTPAVRCGFPKTASGF